MLFEGIAGVKGGRVVVKDSKTRDTTTKEINIDGVAVTIAIDQSPRWGTIYRIWGISNIPNSEIDMSTGWNSLDLLKKEAQKIIHKFYDSKTRDSLQYIKVIPKDFHFVEVYGRYRIYSDGKVFKAVRKDSSVGIVGNSLSYVKERIDSPTTDSLYKGQKVTAIKSEEGLREGETYTVIRGEKPITQSFEAGIKTVYVLQDSSGNLVTVSGCEDLFYRTEDANPIYSVRKNLRTGTIEYDKGGNWLPIEGKIKEAFENEQYIFSRTDKEGYAHYTVQVMDSADTFTKGKALKVKIGEIQKNMDAARKMGYDTAQYQKEIDKLQEDTYTGDPLTEKGKEIMKAMKEQYGEEKGEQVFYTSKNKGSISGVDLKTKDNLLTPEMIKQLQQAYNRIERVDPSLPTYTKIITLLDKLSNEQLKQLSNAGIKFISGLARNRVKDAKTKDAEFNIGDRVKVEGPIAGLYGVKGIIKEKGEVQTAAGLNTYYIIKADDEYGREYKVNEKRLVKV